MLRALADTGLTTGTGRAPGCPKRMRYGPCGGVKEDLTCELAPSPCPFTELDAPVPWAGPVAPRRAGDPLGVVGRPFVLTDCSARRYDRANLAGVVEVLAGASDGLLVGDHQNAPDFPPTVMASLVREFGGRPWITLTCRDRNRVVLEQELEGLAVAGASAVFCATGDGRATGIRPEVTQVFDLDGTQLVSLAASTGLRVGVPEAPEAPPRALRAPRLLEKQRAGAQVCVLNHVSSPAGLAGFLHSARALGVRMPVIAAVAVYTDERSATILRNFPGLHLDGDRVTAVLDSPDPVAAGIEEAVSEARSLLAIEGVAGINVSGGGSARGKLVAAEIKAEVGRRILEEFHAR